MLLHDIQSYVIDFDTRRAESDDTNPLSINVSQIKTFKVNRINFNGHANH